MSAQNQARGAQGTPTGESTEVLLDLAKTGDREALGELLLRFEGEVVWSCRRVFTSEARRQDLEEAISAALVDIVAGASSIQATSIGQFVMWLRTVSRHAAIRVGRRSARIRTREFLQGPESNVDGASAEAELSFDPSDSSQWDPGDLVIERAGLDRCLDRLQEQRPNHWGALQLTADGYRMPEVAQLMSTSERVVGLQDVKNWLFRARKALMACLDEGLTEGRT